MLRTTKTLRFTSVFIAAGLALGMSSCGKQSAESGSLAKSIKIAYEQSGDDSQMSTWLKGVKTSFEKDHPGVTLDPVPIRAADSDYAMKLNLMNRSASTAPDIMMLDTVRILPDSDAGYLAPLDTYIKDWADWNQFIDAAKQVGVGTDGHTYGIPIGTDTRGLWYRKDLVGETGVSGDWKPKSWDEILQVARSIKAKHPDVIPFNIYSGKPSGEAASMQGFEMLLYGTPSGTLYDAASKKWVVGSKQFKDSLNFIKTVFSEGLAPKPQDALDPQIGNKVSQEWLPQGKLAMALDGNWLHSTWLPDGDAKWAEWQTKMGWTGFPTQTGQKPGTVSMSGGWAVSLSAQSSNKELAFEALKTMLSKDNSLKYDVNNGQIAVRNDVAASPEYSGSDPTKALFTSLVATTHFRPTTSGYDQVSDAITVAMEDVMTGSKSVDQAAADYDKSVEKTVGADKVIRLTETAK